jgi:hypothetical protein
VFGADLRHVGHGEQVVDPSQFLEFALVQNRDPVAHVLHVGQQVAAHHDGPPLSPQPQNHVLHFPRADRVQTAGWLVEQN